MFPSKSFAARASARYRSDETRNEDRSDAPTDSQMAQTSTHFDPAPSLTHTLREAARHGERAVLLCSFQKEESVLLDELLRLDQGTGRRGADRDDRHRRAVRGDDADVARVRGALRREDRGVGREQPGRRRGAAPSTAARSPRSPRSSARWTDAEGWITGIRREQGPTRAATELIERDDARGLWKYNPLAHWTDKDLWRRIHERDLPYNPLHDQGYESIGCAPCTQPGSGREGRWAGTDKTECGLHVESSSAPEMSVAARPQLSHLRALESEAIHVMREVAAEFERPVLLFSGGKDSIVLLRLAEKAFRPAPFPFPLMHVDTGHNFPEVIEFRDRRVAELGERLIVAACRSRSTRAAWSRRRARARRATSCRR